jgi:hypothetical protein
MAGSVKEKIVVGWHGSSEGVGRCARFRCGHRNLQLLCGLTGVPLPLVTEWGERLRCAGIGTKQGQVRPEWESLRTQTGVGTLWCDIVVALGEFENVGPQGYGNVPGNDGWSC